MVLSNLESGADICMGRCLCVHATHQAVDAIIQSILFERQIVPRVVPSILEEAAELDLQQLSLHDDLDESVASPKLSDCQRFTKEFTQIRDSLRDVFRSCNRKKVVEVLLLIGPPYLPREIYRMPIRLEHCDSEREDNDGCGENCGPLAMREVRKVSSVMIVQPPSAKFEKLPRSSASRKVSIYVRAKQSAQLPDAFEEDESFELPTVDLATKRKVGVATVRLQHGGTCKLHDESSLLADIEETGDNTAAWFSHSSRLLGFTDD